MDVLWLHGVFLRSECVSDLQQVSLNQSMQLVLFSTLITDAEVNLFLFLMLDSISTSVSSLFNIFWLFNIFLLVLFDSSCSRGISAPLGLAELSLVSELSGALHMGSWSFTLPHILNGSSSGLLKSFTEPRPARRSPRVVKIEREMLSRGLEVLDHSSPSPGKQHGFIVWLNISGFHISGFHIMSPPAALPQMYNIHDHMICRKPVAIRAAGFIWKLRASDHRWHLWDHTFTLLELSLSHTPTHHHLCVFTSTVLADKRL